MHDTSAPPNVRHGGRILADQLRILGADRLFCVPGESFLGLLDGLYDHRNAISVVTCRQEAGAANMAEAHAKLTGRPGICAVTRGPGATNAANGVHTAFQDSTPMILLIGQVGRAMADREAFQEIDYRRMFGQMAKWVAQIDDIARIPEYLSRAWTTALSGRPGPVVLALPEDVLSARADVPDIRPVQPATSAPTPAAMQTLSQMLAQARKPMLVVGGGGWSAECARLTARIAERFDLPVATSFRAQDYIDNTHPNFAGVLGIAPIPDLIRRVKDQADLIIAVGPRFGEMTTQGYSLIDIPVPQMRLVHVHPGPEETGQVIVPDLAVTATPVEFLRAMTALPAPDTDWSGWTRAHNASYRAWREPTGVPGPLNMGQVIRHLSDALPEDAIITNGAGNYAVWLHRFHQHRRYRTQLAPTSGSMGYGVPAAVAAKLAAPDREVVCVAGDGCFMMSAQELATARHMGAGVIWLVVNNAMFGTIRMHQERNYPARIISTALTNPDFVAYAAAFAIPGEVVRDTAAFPDALARARKSDAGYLIELQVDPQALTPTQTLDAARAQGETAKHKEPPT
jgi:acetolactate synthase I/II/III large subunit